MMPFAASILVKVTVIAVLALGGARLARRSRASVRHVLLAAAFAVILVLPVASTVAPSVRVEVPIAAQVGIVSAPPEPVPDASSADVTGDAGAVITPMFRSRWPSLPALLVASWIAGAAILLVPVVAGLWQIRTIRRGAQSWERGRPLLEPLAPDARIGRRVDLLLHESVAGPMTCGLLRPAIVLPMNAETWPEEDVRRAIVHELEHVRRADWVTHCLSRIVCACYWFHPLVWIASRRLSLEAERACDDAVLRRADAAAYADQLLALARHLSAAPPSPLLAMANRHDLSTRVLAVLDSSQQRGRAGARWLALGCAASALLVTTMSPLRLVAVAASADKHGQAAVGGERFDVVSIKRCADEPAAPASGSRGRGGGAGNVTASPGTLHIDCMTMQNVIDRAYVFYGEPLLNESGPPREDTPRVKGGPAWLRSEKYTIEAKASTAADRNVMMGPMLRAFLEDRLELKLHRDSEEIEAYALTVAKGGMKIKPMSEGGCIPFDPDKAPSPTIEAPRPPAGLPMCGTVARSRKGATRVVDLGGMELEILMVVLKLDRRVIDRTGINDRFNIHFEYEPDESQADPSDFAGSNIFRALEQQLGLKLEPIKAPHGVLVIDRVVRP